MSQALYTSMGGINTAQYAVNVVANNVANINTTAFKSADARFQTLFSDTLTTGNAPTKTTGGKNPKQIGLGVKLGAIVRNFEGGTFKSTGRTEDLMISGSGYFTVMDSNGSIFLTRDGSFTLDSNGDMVDSNGYHVLGASQLYNTSASTNKINVPQTIKTTVTGSTNMGSTPVKDLNDSTIIEGTFDVKVIDSTGLAHSVTVTISEADLEGSASGLADTIATQIRNNVTPALPAETTISVSCETDGTMKFNVMDTRYDDTDPAFATQPSFSFRAGTSNFLEATKTASAEGTFDPATKSMTYNSKILDYSVTVEPVAALVEAVDLFSYSIAEDGTIEATYANGDKLTVEVNNDDNTFHFKYTTSTGVIIRADKVDVNRNIAVPENLVLQMAKVTNEAGLVSLAGNVWQSGPNAGDMVFAVGGAMGIGTVQTGGLESSNVDLSRELATMIISQRAIQANSRVFSTSSSIMESLTYLGN